MVVSTIQCRVLYIQIQEDRFFLLKTFHNLLYHECLIYHSQDHTFVLSDCLKNQEPHRNTLFFNSSSVSVHAHLIMLLRSFLFMYIFLSFKMSKRLDIFQREYPDSNRECIGVLRDYTAAFPVKLYSHIMFFCWR